MLPNRNYIRGFRHRRGEATPRPGDRTGRPYVTDGDPARRNRPLLALLAVLLVLVVGTVTADAQDQNAAGLVVRHGDGTLVYVYVQFEEESIDGLDLLTRSGLDVTVAPYGGLGGGICKINDEGCSSDNCFCHSYSSPAYYWHYYVLDDGDWVEYPRGAASRDLSDGDVDGWSWTAGDPGLPEIDIQDIATISAGPTPTAKDATHAVSTPTAIPASRAVVIEAGSTPVALVSEDRSENEDDATYLIFVGMAIVVVAVGGFAVLRNRASAS